MLTVPAQIQTLFKTDGIRKNFRVHFPNGEHTDLTNADIIQESVSFKESVCSKDTFQYGLSERSQIEFECVGVPNIYGAEIECGIEIDTSTLSAADITAIQADPGDGTLVLEADSDIGYGFYRVPYGVFIVESCPRSHGAMWRRKVTAYSYSVSDSPSQAELLNRSCPYSKWTVTNTMLQAMLDETTFDTIDTPTINAQGPTEWFHNSSGNLITVSVGGSSWVKYCSLSKTLGSGPAVADAFKVTYEADLDTYDANGRAIAAALTSAGVNLCYNNQKKKIYADNETALRKVMPYLFAPAVTCFIRQVRSDQSSVKDANLDYAVLPESGVMTYLGGVNGNGLIGTFQDASYNRTYPSFSYVTLPSAQTVSITYERWTNDNSASPSSTNTITVNLAQSEVTVSDVKAYYCSSSDGGFSFEILPTLRQNNVFHTRMNYVDATNRYGKDVVLTGYSYSNAISFRSILEGYLELTACMGRFDRTGSFVSTRLSTTSPEQIIAAEYSDFWWDDYTIDNIGTVLFKSGDTVYRYEFGNGRSVYDMSDNALLDHLVLSEDDTVHEICTLLDNNFIPYASPIKMVPADLTMIGPPYFEAGDYIEVDDGNSGTVLTYILEHNIDGIQTLADTIATAGGDIVES